MIPTDSFMRFPLECDTASTTGPDTVKWQYSASQLESSGKCRTLCKAN